LVVADASHGSVDPSTNCVFLWLNFQERQATWAGGKDVRDVAYEILQDLAFPKLLRS
jgi:hypothetical protein